MDQDLQSPIIGVIAHKIRPGQDGSKPIDGQYGDYCRSLALAGGAPVLIPLDLDERAYRTIYEQLDGILFPGGVDVAPRLYHQEPLPQLGRVDDALDKTELLLARWALAEHIPVLGICRGIQLLNVAAGGSLYQDIPAQIPQALSHACPDTPSAHQVDIEPGTRLADALGTLSCWTNSRHHQAIKDVAPGFTVTAHASDGTIEGIEIVDAPFFVGVQWHPENLAPTDTQMLGLFQAFVHAC
ncbi:MAG: gamma-glutamyl-gamma-aminobutyrate hydrolase family protein, partial [Anaerolineae bacterium]|nr:gamma-glutamyl-gamma-aminobutyrate hydrolase family protein [Anaerolineae bacterium]